MGKIGIFVFIKFNCFVFLASLILLFSVVNIEQLAWGVTSDDIVKAETELNNAIAQKENAVREAGTCNQQPPNIFNDCTAKLAAARDATTAVATAQNSLNDLKNKKSAEEKAAAEQKEQRDRDITEARRPAAAPQPKTDNIKLDEYNQAIEDSNKSIDENDKNYSEGRITKDKWKENNEKYLSNLAQAQQGRDEQQKIMADAQAESQRKLETAKKDVTKSERKVEDVQRHLDNGRGYEIDQADAGGVGTVNGPDSLCKTSSQLNGKFATCEGTESLTEGAQIANVVAQGVGSAVTQAAGQSAQAQASQQGTQSSAIRGGASTAKTAGMAQMIGGVMNLGMGVAQLSAASDHKKNAAEIQKALGKKSFTYSASKEKEMKGDFDHLKGVESLNEDALDNFKIHTGSKGLKEQEINKNARGNDENTHHGYLTSTEGGLVQDGIDNFSLQERGKLYGVYSKKQDFVDIDARITTAKARLQAAEALPPTDPSKPALVLQYKENLEALRENKKKLLVQRRDELELRGTTGVNAKKSDFNRQLNRIGNEGAGEQKSIASKAKAGGFQSTMQGIGQIAGGLLSLQAAKEMKQAADKLDQANRNAANVIVPRFNANSFQGDQLAARSATSVTGAGTTEDDAAAAEEKKDEENNTLGPPIAGAPKDGITAPLPEPGKFNPDSSVGGGGSGHSLGGGSTSASGAGADTDPSSKYAENLRNPGGYIGSGGGGGYVGGGGGGGGGGTVNPEVDMASLLGKLLPKDEEKQKDILQYANRGPAADDNYSLLDRNVNIFQRIHDTYQAKNKKGQVGL